MAGQHYDGPKSHIWQDLLKSRLTTDDYLSFAKQLFPSFVLCNMSVPLIQLLVNCLIVFRARCSPVIQNTCRRNAKKNGNIFVFDSVAFKDKKMKSVG